MNSFYSQYELESLGLKFYGKDVLISKKASIYSPGNISIGDNVRVDDFCILSGVLNIGSHVHIAAFTALYGGTCGVKISDFVNISSRVSIYGVSDDYSGESMTSPVIPTQYKLVQSAPVIIEKHAIIGASSVILPGSIIREGSSLGCFSMLKGETKPWSIYAGIPVKKIQDRKKQLLKSEKKFLAQYKNASMD